MLGRDRAQVGEGRHVRARGEVARDCFGPTVPARATGKLISFIVLFWAATAAIAAGRARSLDDYGPRPSWARATVLGARAIRERTVDYPATRIEWPRQLLRATLRLPGLRPVRGWYTCGIVYRRDEARGFKGRDQFMIVFRNDSVVLLQIGTSEGIDPATAVCTGLAPAGWISRPAAP